MSRWPEQARPRPGSNLRRLRKHARSTYHGPSRDSAIVMAWLLEASTLPLSRRLQEGRWREQVWATLDSVLRPREPGGEAWGRGLGPYRLRPLPATSRRRLGYYLPRSPGERGGEGVLQGFLGEAAHPGGPWLPCSHVRPLHAPQRNRRPRVREQGLSEPALRPGTGATRTRTGRQWSASTQARRRHRGCGMSDSPPGDWGGPQGQVTGRAGLRL